MCAAARAMHARSVLPRDLRLPLIVTPPCTKVRRAALSQRGLEEVFFVFWRRTTTRRVLEKLTTDASEECHEHNEACGFDFHPCNNVSRSQRQLCGKRECVWRLLAVRLSSQTKGHKASAGAALSAACAEAFGFDRDKVGANCFQSMLPQSSRRPRSRPAPLRILLFARVLCRDAVNRKPCPSRRRPAVKSRLGEVRRTAGAAEACLHR